MERKNIFAQSFVSFCLAGILPSSHLFSTPLQEMQLPSLYQSVQNSSQENPITSGNITYENTDLEGNIWATENANVNLIFTNGYTWKMDASGIQVNNTNIIIHTPIIPITQGSIPTLKFRQDSTRAFQNLELINTGAKVILWQKGAWRANTKLADSFTLRGTTLETYWGNGESGGNTDGLHGNTTQGINLVFAKGSKLDTTLTDSAGKTLKITDKEVDKNHSGDYHNGVYDGNHIAQSYGKITKIVTDGSFSLTFIGEDSHNSSLWSSGGKFGKDSKLTLINASGSNGFDAGKIGDFFKDNAHGNASADIVIEGTSISGGENIVKRSSHQDKLNFYITFAKEGLLTHPSSNNDKEYVGDIFNTHTTSNANGAISDKILKIGESQLNGGIDFKNSNAFVNFLGNSQNFSSTNILKGGSSSSIYTFRASDLNLGTASSQSIQSVKGTIAFDLSHYDENMKFGTTGIASRDTVGNMFDSSSNTKKYQTIYNLNGEQHTINRLVFADPTQLKTLNSLNLLAKNGNYYGDSEVFGSLGTMERAEEYEKIGQLQHLDPTKNSKLITLYNIDFALNGSKQELIFIGDKSHRFANNLTAGKDNHRLGDSSDSMLTFIDAGEIFRERIINLDKSNHQQGKGIINLIGTTQMELKTDGNTKTLTLADGVEKGAGLTLNAIYTGENPLGDGGDIKADAPQSTTTPTSGHKASSANIGISGEQTIYHILFDYTSSNLSFGEHQAYTGTITGLTKDSKIKFKNAGYIWKNQIANTSAGIILDNTQLREDLRADNAVLDYRHNKISVAGSILTSDVSANPVLSQKILTFDFTGTTGFGLQFRDSYKIQAGRKVASAYTTEADSRLTFQNAPLLNLTAQRATPNILDALASSTGFKSFSGASLNGDDFAQNHATKSYILEGADLIFEGTSIQGNIIENHYDLKFTFDSNPTNQTALQEQMQASSIQGSITMGDNRNLDLTLKNNGAIIGDKLDVTLGNHSVFTLNASSTNGNAGVVVLQNMQNNGILDAKSSVNIQEGSLSFIGNFDSTKDTATSSNIGSFIASFGDTTQGHNNKIYGMIKHKGALNLTLTGDALFSDDEAQKLGFTKGSEQFANLVIDLTTPKTLNLTLHHTSGVVGLIGKSVGENGSLPNGFTNYDLTSSTGKLAIKGAFDLGKRDSIFDGNLSLAGTTALQMQNQYSLVLKDVGATHEGNINLYIDPRVGQGGQNISLTLVNLASNIQVRFYNKGGWTTAQNYQGTWNIRGTNIVLDRVFSAEKSNNPINMVFAKGSGREVTHDPATPQNKTMLTLDMLSGEDKINPSSLSGNFSKIDNGAGTLHPDGFGSSLILKTASLTFVGKEALGIAVGQERIDGSFNSGSNLQIKLYNSILQDGSILLDSSLATIDSSCYQYKITDTSHLLGTDTFNLSVSRIPTPSNDSYGKRLIAFNHSTINATFINDGGSSTGERYINPSNSPYASQYATNDAGGALSQPILKTLYSKAYGNIKLDDTATANLRFIGENSHSFDGKTAVYTGSDAPSKKDGGIYYNPQGDKNKENWKKVTIDEKGLVSIGTTPLNQTQNITLATLSGGNANSRFYFDHTSIKLDLVKNAGGKTYIYNSNIIGEIAVNNANTFGSTTIFFNQAFDKAPSPIAQAFLDFYQKEGISIDLSTPHLLKNQHLTEGKLAHTDKATNIVLIGKKAYEQTKESDEGINLSFLPKPKNSAGYNYTIVSGGVLDIVALEGILGSTNTERPNNPTGVPETLFGDSKVHLIDTQIIGRISFAQVGFVNVEKNQRSLWTGGSTQYLIYNFNNGKSNLSTTYLQEYAIQNRSSSSRYIFTGIFENSNIAQTNRVLTLGKNGLRNAINSQLTRAKTTIDEFVVGYLGLRGVSIRGDIDEDLGTISSNDTLDLQGNSVDIVFNSTRNIAYEEYFDESGEHQANFKLGYANLVSTGLDDPTKISGYAVLKPSSKGADVTIKGNAHKDIVFIGKDAVEGGFSHLKILEGSEQSKYTFHSVGTLDSVFLQGIQLQKNSTNTTANLGVFTFYNSRIEGNIDIDKHTSDNSKEPKLIFENVSYQGEISGTMIKHLKFGENSNVTILGGNSEDVFDFGGLANKEIYLNLEMKGSNGKYQTPQILGLEEGNVSVVGHFDLALNKDQLEDSTKPLPSLAFKDGAKWSMSASSNLSNLYLSNSSTSYNLDLASAPRTISPKSTTSGFRTLTVTNLDGNNGQILLGAALDTQNQANSHADSICSENTNGSFVLGVKDKNLIQATFDTQNNPIILVTTQKGNASIQGRQEKSGLMILSTSLEHQIQKNGSWEAVNEENFNDQITQRWVLSSLSVQENTELINEGIGLISNPYRMLLIESNNLNKRMGDLRNNPYPQGSWIRIFNGMDNGEGIKNLYTNIQLGYDSGWQTLGGKDYFGVAFSTSIIDLKAQSYTGKANTYSFALYNSYITDFGLYVDSIFKYLYTSQSISPNWGSQASFGNHALSLGAEIGYQAYIAKTDFYLEPQFEMIYGYINGVQNINLGIYGGKNIVGELQSTHSLYLRAGGVMGYTFKTQGDFSADLRVGASFVSEQISNANPIHFNDGTYFVHQSIDDDIKALINIGTNLIVNEQWRVYVDLERTFGGKRNTEYQANVGVRFSFGEQQPKDPTQESKEQK